MMKTPTVRMLLSAAVLAVAVPLTNLHADPTAPDAPAVPPYKLLPHSDSAFAHTLLRLGQVDSIKAEAAAAKGPAENLWKAEEIVATWDTLSQNRVENDKATAAYLADMNAYLDATTAGIDGLWAMDNAKFIYGKFSSTILDRMEYWGAGAKDRAALAPRADLGERLLHLALLSLTAQETEAYAPGHAADDNMYMRAYGAMGEVEYYGAWGKYFKAMSLEPGTKDRNDLLTAAATTLGKWADDTSDNGVNKQALLLRGKAESEAGNLDKAVEDLNKARSEGSDNIKAPDWVKYQAQYQVIVTRIRAGDFDAAFKELDEFKKTLPPDNAVAAMSTEMLRYRIAWAQAQKQDGKAKQDGEIKALAILGDIIKKDPRFRDLIYEQLIAQIPAGADVKTLLPMQQLAIAYSKSSGQQGKTPDSRLLLQDAINAALAVRNNAASTPGEKLEATYLAGVCSAVLGKLQDAVTYNVDFVATAPDDPRSKDLLANVVMPQIGDLKALAMKTNTPLSPEINKTIETALELSSGKFHDTRYLFAQGRTLEDSGNLLGAAKAYSQIPENDPTYVDARYRLVAISTTRLSQLTAQKAPDADVRNAADDLLSACTRFVQLLDNPPKGIPPAQLEQLRTYRTNILMIEASTALNPAVKKPDVALERLDQLDKTTGLTDLQKGAILRYRIEAYQAQGQMDKIMPLLSQYAKASKQNTIDVFRGMAKSTVEEIDEKEKTDPEQARQLADFVVKLFDPIIDQEAKDSQAATDPKEKELHKKNAYDLKQIKADMMVRSGDYKGATALCEQLIAEDNKDIRSFMTEAKASYLKATVTKDAKDFAYAQDYFTRILPRITPGVDSWWECWLRILQCKEAQGGPGVAAEIKKTLSDLKASQGNFGGVAFKQKFDEMVAKYGA